METAKRTDGRKELRFHLKQQQSLAIRYDYRPGFRDHQQDKSTLLLPCSTVPRCMILACLKALLDQFLLLFLRPQMCLIFKQKSNKYFYYFLLLSKKCNFEKKLGKKIIDDIADWVACLMAKLVATSKWSQEKSIDSQKQRSESSGNFKSTSP